jgi:hypothetical protein
MSKEIQYKLAESIKEKYVSLNIISNETEPYTLYCEKDVAKIFNTNTIRCITRDYDDNDKIKVSSKTKGGLQPMSYLTYSGLLKFLEKSKKKETIDFIKMFDIDIKKNICIETTVIKSILDAFKGENIVIKYKINNYFIDLYFKDYNLVINCEEDDKIKEEYIKSKINCNFIKYDLSQKNFNIIHLINDIYIFIKNKNIELKENNLKKELPIDELSVKFITESCIIGNQFQESFSNIEGQFRIWSKIKPNKEAFTSLKNYLDTKFKSCRIQDKNGYIGIKLKDIEYNKKFVENDVENFIFEKCIFSPTGKILYSVLLTEYQKWKESLNKELNQNDLKEIKKYLNSCEYVLRSTVWVENKSNEGYYGLILKSDENKKPTSVSKKINKIEISTGKIIESWDSFANAAECENISTSKMSRSVKNKTVFNDNYYYAANSLTQT